jgi:hypothetical protein
MPSAKSANTPAPLSNIERILQTSSKEFSSSAATEPPHLTVTPAPMKSFRRREPKDGKMNVFTVDDDELAIERDDDGVEVSQQPYICD